MQTLEVVLVQEVPGHPSSRRKIVRLLPCSRREKNPDDNTTRLTTPYSSRPLSPLVKSCWSYFVKSFKWKPSISHFLSSVLRTFLVPIFKYLYEINIFFRVKCIEK